MEASRRAQEARSDVFRGAQALESKTKARERAHQLLEAMRGIHVAFEGASIDRASIVEADKQVSRVRRQPTKVTDGNNVIDLTLPISASTAPRGWPWLYQSASP